MSDQHRTEWSPDASSGGDFRNSAVKWALRCMGLIDMCALMAVVMPKTWMAIGHEMAGLGELPTEPIVGYLARSASALYALHGTLMFYASFDVPRYWPLIRFFAAIAVWHGVIMLYIDLTQGMPQWWTLVEGPCFAMTGIIILVLQGLGDKRR